MVCGQRAANRIVPLWQVTNEFLEDLFDLDLRILKTFPTFFLQPGQSFTTVAMKTIALLFAHGIILVCSLVLLVIGTVALM